MTPYPTRGEAERQRRQRERDERTLVVVVPPDDDTPCAVLTFADLPRGRGVLKRALREDDDAGPPAGEIRRHLKDHAATKLEALFTDE